MAWVLGILAAVIAAAIGYRMGRRRVQVTASAVPMSADTEHIVDLLRRAHGAMVGVVLEADADPLVARDVGRSSAEQVERGTALARVALGDERRHRLDDPATAVAAAHDGMAVALVFAQPISASAATASWRTLVGCEPADHVFVAEPRRR